MESLARGTVLVTGSTGFIGSHLVERLVELGCRVRCLVRRTSSLRYLPAGAVELVYGDLAGGEGLTAALRDVTTVFHLAGVTKAHNPARYYEGNVDTTGCLYRAMEALPQPPSRIVVVSSLAAIGPSADGTPLAEDAPPHPLTHYGRSKLAAEQMLAHSPLFSRTVMVRPAVVYGPRDPDVFEIFRSVWRGVFLTIGRRDSYFSYIYVRDLVEALLAAAQSPAAGRAYFAASTAPVSWRNFSSEIARAAHRRFHTLAVPASAAYLVAFLAEWGAQLRKRPSILSREKIKEARCRYWVCDVSRARAELGFVASTPLSEGVAETLAWYKRSEWIKA
jgi:dihydroflavonol-4-reductase